MLKDDIKLQNIEQAMPVLAMRGLVFFPGMMLQFDVARTKSIEAVNAAADGERLIFLAAQTDLSDDEPQSKDIYSMGVIAKIHQVVRNQPEGIKLHVEGIARAEMISILTEEPFIHANVLEIPTAAYRKSRKTEAMNRIIYEKFEEYVRLFKRLSPDVFLGVVQETDCGKLADYITMNIGVSFDKKQFILDEVHPVKRLEKLIKLLSAEIEILKIESDIHKRTQTQIDENQRDYYLKEQMRAIQYELGEDDNPLQEAELLKKQIEALGLEPVHQEKLIKECEKLERMSYASQEASVIRVYLDTCLALPWNKSSKEKIDLPRAQKILDRDHYGMTKVKERFLEILAVRKLAPEQNAQIICLVGPPGVGKTSIAKSVAQALGRQYVRVSLGGVSDEAEIMGHRKTYVGSMPGRIINALKQAKTNNPLILLDEIDKLGTHFRGDPASALLEVLDPEQNREFTDRYMEIPFNLQNVLFITTANDASSIPGPLYDRMDVIPLTSYTLDEKFNIATKHLIRKQLKNHGLKATQLKFQKQAVYDLIDGYTREAGVRSLERNIASICRKVAKKIVMDTHVKSFTVTSDNLEELLGPKRFCKDNSFDTNTVGLVNGLAWTSVGGEMLPIEVAVMKGKGKIQLTGSLGNVMKESASAAITCIRTRADKLGIQADFHEKYDIHLHAPEGAVPKDGPSAGIAMATSITSALLNIPVKHTMAMTGEITLQGRVLPIGGLKEKSMAAYKNGIKTVIIPWDNQPDLAEIDAVVKENVEFVPVKMIDTVLELALEKSAFKKEKKGKVLLDKPIDKSRLRTEKPSEMLQ
ncbi:endopeptidase La [Scatolibacter rhodanostii]|uniref:endopeptidase La n=1 Tax=Scatolibacter rhodanostii TaxID=2014781 RepID=UPI000C083F6C|nr:endopeptidase La [Scatolibacter rhodanostii]